MTNDYLDRFEGDNSLSFRRGSCHRSYILIDKTDSIEHIFPAIGDSYAGGFF